MLSETRTIFFQTELVLPPLKEFRIGRPKIRALYNKMHEPGGHPYENIETNGENTTLSTKRDNGTSVCHFGSSSLRIQEDHPDCDVDGFIDIAKTVLRGLGEDFPPFVLLQRCRIQCTVKPQHMNSILLLAGKVANVHDRFISLGRRPTYFGVRFRFLPMHMLMEDIGLGGDDEFDGDNEDGGDDDEVEGESSQASHGDQRETEDVQSASNLSDDAFMTLRFETYSKDITQVWIEAAAEFRAFTEKGVFTSRDIERMGENIKDTYRFITERCVKFLEQFDQPHDEHGDEP